MRQKEFLIGFVLTCLVGAALGVLALRADHADQQVAIDRVEIGALTDEVASCKAELVDALHKVVVCYQDAGQENH